MAASTLFRQNPAEETTNEPLARNAEKYFRKFPKDKITWQKEIRNNCLTSDPISEPQVMPLITFLSSISPEFKFKAIGSQSEPGKFRIYTSLTLKKEKEEAEKYFALVNWFNDNLTDKKSYWALETDQETKKYQLVWHMPDSLGIHMTHDNAGNAILGKKERGLIDDFVVLIKRIITLRNSTNIYRELLLNLATFPRELHSFCDPVKLTLSLRFTNEKLIQQLMEVQQAIQNAIDVGPKIPAKRPG